MILTNNKLTLLFLFFIYLLNASNALASNDITSPSYSNEASLIRAEQWQALITGAAFDTDHQKLKQVNDFFNQNISFVTDINQWNTIDYWATPEETLMTGAGDCEDYSIAKYFALLKLGIGADKLRITYVKVAKLETAHMVLSYLAYPGASPLFLDNLIPEIKPASQRSDLTSLFSFNNNDLWITSPQGIHKKISQSSYLTKWDALKSKMQANRESILAKQRS